MRLSSFAATTLAIVLCAACSPITTPPVPPQPPITNMPASADQQLAIRNAIETYIRAHIGELSPEPPVLGGKFYVTNFKWQPNGTVIVSYEDGHIALVGLAKVRTSGTEVLVDSFALVPGNSPNPSQKPTTEEATKPDQATEETAVKEPIPPAPAIIGMANPASVHCQEVGGMLRIEKKPPAGGEYGVCYFDNNRQCEEWALFRGNCPVGGMKVTGYITPAARYCAITGGTYKVTGNNGEEQGTCTYKGGYVCDVWELWDGRCQAQ